jgi:hypothetical protein
VEDNVVTCDCLFDGGEVQEIGHNQPKSAALEAFSKVGAPAQAQIVESRHPVAFGKESLNQIASNETSSTCDKYAHWICFL